MHPAHPILRAGAALLLATLALAAAADQAPRTVRYGNALFAIPAGWERKALTYPADYDLLETTDPQAPKFSSIQIYVYRERPIVGAPDAFLTAWAKEHADRLHRGPDYVVNAEAPLGWARHPSGARMLIQHLSYGSKKGTGRNHEVIVYLDGGEVAQAIMLEAAAMGADEDSRALLGRHRKTFQDLIASLRLPSRTILAPAPTPADAPLSAYRVEAVTDFLEWLLDVPFTAAQRDGVRDHLVAAWKANDRAEIEGLASVLQAKSQLDALDADKRKLVRDAARGEVVKLLRAQAGKGDATSAMLLAAYDAAHAPLARGGPDEPALTRHAADASLEAMHFMAAAVAGVSPARAAPTKAQSDQWAAALAADYAAMPAETKQELASAPVAWAALRLSWDALPDGARAELIKQWSQTPAVAALAAKLRDDQSSLDARNVMRQYDAHRRLIDMGAYRLGRPYRYY